MSLPVTPTGAAGSRRDPDYAVATYDPEFGFRHHWQVGDLLIWDQQAV